MHDTTHDMYQPDRRAKRTAPPKMPEAMPDVQTDREAWMKQKQARKEYEPVPRRSDRVEKVIAGVCQEFHVTRRDLLSPSRSRSVSQARGEACRQLHKLGKSYPEIAIALEIRNHTSVIYHCQEKRRAARYRQAPFNPNQPDESGIWNI